MNRPRSPYTRLTARFACESLFSVNLIVKCSRSFETVQASHVQDLIPNVNTEGSRDVETVYDYTFLCPY